jgi:nitrite reductase/ring-hydroxylating ferredoxin subunit
VIGSGFGGSVAGKLFAFDDLCTLDNVLLSAGLLKGTTLMCQCGGSRFDLTTGRVLRGPATLALATYEVREQDGEIQVRI